MFDKATRVKCDAEAACILQTPIDSADGPGTLIRVAISMRVPVRLTHAGERETIWFSTISLRTCLLFKIDLMQLSSD